MSIEIFMSTIPTIRWKDGDALNKHMHWHRSLIMQTNKLFLYDILISKMFRIFFLFWKKCCFEEFLYLCNIVLREETSKMRQKTKRILIEGQLR
jgi:hypothetical protein